ncbi:hypothetical protein [Pyxidicoccus caerfyrddinensis]|uniref:hypothetical protein n=1 Tax=Pyxidicoccus caerfyrddinensis TaxID=2709663 RepID=UPI0013DBCB9E|nr:hypothetical protein [Pyxidicoccus caerfyrddinensis]
MSTNPKKMTPAQAAQLLRNHPIEAKGSARAADASYNVCLGYEDGEFTLSWSATSVGKWDWVALYPSTSTPNDQQSTYQWASDGNSYGTGVKVQPGFQARYLSWDSVSGQYVTVAQTPAFPNTMVCSS